MPTNESPQRSLRVRWSSSWTVKRDGFAEAGWRGRLASWLRILASRIDGQDCYIVQCDSVPELSHADAKRCLNAGFEHGALLWSGLAKEAAYDALALDCFPGHKDDLFRIPRD
jgi:hypothetical protein